MLVVGESIIQLLVSTLFLHNVDDHYAFAFAGLTFIYFLSLQVPSNFGHFLDLPLIWLVVL